jgi:hypothetical protein
VITELFAQLFSVLILNWEIFFTIQSVVFFWRIILDTFEKILYLIGGMVVGIFSSFFFLISIILGLAFDIGKNEKIIISEYQYSHIYPLLTIICLEFAELLVVIFKYYMAQNNSLQRVRTCNVEFEAKGFNSIYTVFRKPNLAMLQ